jgi:hypothetical protein
MLMGYGVEHWAMMRIEGWKIEVMILIEGKEGQNEWELYCNESISADTLNIL